MTFVDGGRFTMGSVDRFHPEEGPTRVVELPGFWVDPYEVTNAQFSAFVDATGYRTVAERAPEALPGAPPEMLLPGSAVFRMPQNPAAAAQGWWTYVPGATWRYPEGPGTDIEGREHHPVVHVAYADAQAYATWLGRALPTEAQFEFASRGGLEGAAYAWGDTFVPDKVHQANTWQGPFPLVNTEEDGFLSTAPAGCYPANNYGLFDMIGNVWEWTSDYYQPRHLADDAQDPIGSDAPIDPGQDLAPARVIKGGSYLCADSYCARYRPAARHPQDTGLGTNHVGFRTVLPAQ